MASAVLAYKNLADSGAVSVSSALTLTPPSRLTSQFPQIAKKCRNNGENTWAVIVDLLSTQAPDTFGLIGLNNTLLATTRVRLSTADSSGQAGDAYDSGSEVGLIDSKYGYLIKRDTTALPGRYARFDVSESGLSYHEAGRVFVGPSSQVEVSIAPGWGRNRIDLSKQTLNEDGVTYIDRRAKHRLWDLNFEMFSEDEANGFVEEMSYLNGESDDVLLISNPDSTNLGRDSIWGLITGGQPVIEPYAMDEGSRIFSRKYTIRERS